MSPSQDVDSPLEPTAQSGRNSLVNYPAVEEPIHSDSTMHDFERAGILQIPDPESGSETKRTHAIADSQTVEAGQKANTTDYLAWKDAGRPPCQQCLKSHPPPCKSSQEDIDFCQRDPEGYKLYLKSLKPARKKKPRSNRRPELPGHNTSRVSRPALSQAERLYTPGLTQTQRLHTLPAYNRPADPAPSPWLTAVIGGMAIHARNDPERLARIRATIMPTYTTNDHDDDIPPEDGFGEMACRALTRVLEDALESTKDQGTTDQPEQTDDQATADQPEQT